MTELRKCEIFINEKWEEIPFIELKKGCIFRLYDENGELLTNSLALSESDAFINDDGDYVVVFSDLNKEGMN